MLWALGVLGLLEAEAEAMLMTLPLSEIVSASCFGILHRPLPVD